MQPNARKLALTAHVTSSVGWLGAVAAFLALAVAGLTSRDGEMMPAAYLAMELTTWFVILPLAIASLLTGLVMSLGTTWGVFRHYWVVAKLLITILATTLLLVHTRPIGLLADIGETTLSSAEVTRLQVQLVGDASAALLALLMNVVLSVFKPWGMTPYGLRTLHERRGVLPADLPSGPRAEVGVGSTTKTPRWVYVVGIHAIGLALLVLVVHLAGNRGWSH